MTWKPRIRQCAGVALLLALLPLGCRRRDPYTDAHMEIISAEKRDLRDQIYALEEKLAQKENELEVARGAATKTRPKAGILRPLRGSKPGNPPIDDSQLMPPMIEGLVEPMIELPPTDKPAAPNKQSMKPAIDDSPDVDLEPPRSGLGTLSPPTVSRTSAIMPEPEHLADDVITSVFINPQMTRGAAFDARPGDDGILLMLEPRNFAGAFVPQTGAVTVVLIDPELEGDAGRIARWELTKRQVSEQLLATRPERGIKLELKWPGDVPQHSNLKLFVRYESPTGEAIENHCDVAIALAGQLSDRWTPARK